MLYTDFRGVHDDSGDKVEEDVVAVCADTGVAEGHLQLIHGLQKKTLSLILKVFKGGFLKFHQTNIAKTFTLMSDIGKTLNVTLN